MRKKDLLIMRSSSIFDPYRHVLHTDNDYDYHVQDNDLKQDKNSEAHIERQSHINE